MSDKHLGSKMVLQVSHNEADCRFNAEFDGEEGECFSALAVAIIFAAQCCERPVESVLEQLVKMVLDPDLFYQRPKTLN